jgi:hypothetical protein
LPIRFEELDDDLTGDYESKDSCANLKGFQGQAHKAQSLQLNIHGRKFLIGSDNKI